MAENLQCIGIIIVYGSRDTVLSDDCYNDHADLFALITETEPFGGAAISKRKIQSITVTLEYNDMRAPVIMRATNTDRRLTWDHVSAVHTLEDLLRTRSEHTLVRVHSEVTVTDAGAFFYLILEN